jgi:serine protease Do
MRDQCCSAHAARDAAPRGKHGGSRQCDSSASGFSVRFMSHISECTLQSVLSGMTRRREIWAIGTSLILGFLIVQLTSYSLERRREPVREPIRAAAAESLADYAAKPRVASVDLPRECAPTSIAGIVEKTLPSVVNISSTRVLRDGETASIDGSSPPVKKLFRELPFNPFSGKDGRRETSLGSGVLVTADGVLLTNNHVVENAEIVEVTLSDTRVFVADILGADPQSDLAVLRIRNSPKDLIPIEFGTATTIRLGDPVIAIGNPFGVGQTVTQGIVSAKGRADLGIVDYEDFIQTDAAINPGNSGGALVGTDGKLVGINTAILSRTGGYQGISFAIPTDMAIPIMRELIEHGRVVRGWLGVGIQDLTPTVATALGMDSIAGVIVADVGDDSPASRAGLRPRDIVMAIDGEAIATAVKLRNRIALLGAGKVIELRVLRDKKSIAVRARLGALPVVDRTVLKQHPADSLAPRSAPSGFSLEPKNVRAFRASTVKRDC